jgi:Icc-related predicted phosphoesterase
VKHGTRRAICLFDLHIGSNYAICPPGFKVESDDETRELVPYPRQLKLWNIWSGELAKMVNDFKPDTVFLGGDTTHGANWHDYGRDRLTPDLDTQALIAERVLREIVMPDMTVVWIRGSGYHTSLDTWLEEHIAKSVSRSVKAGGSYGLFGFGRHNLFVTHQLSGSTPNAWRTQLRDARAGQALEHLDKVDAVIAGHIHEPQSYKCVFGEIHVMPSFSLLEPSKVTAKRALTFAAVSEVGIGFVESCEGGLWVWSQCWRLPQIARRVV